MDATLSYTERHPRRILAATIAGLLLSGLLIGGGIGMATTRAFGVVVDSVSTP